MVKNPNEDTVSEKAKKLRREYTQRTLNEQEIVADPFSLFLTWFDEAISAELYEPNAMILSTATREGRPSSRTVLLKETTQEGFVFYSNYESKKGIQLSDNPYAALLFLWGPLERQIRIEGSVSILPQERSKEYFYSRPRNAQLGALASPQSQTIGGRSELEKRFQELEARYAGQEIPYPEHWGGYIVLPHGFEFWQGRENRLHDRILYLKDDKTNWKHMRLAP